MVGKEKLFSLMEEGLSLSRSPQVEISAISKLQRAVRFANSVVHQPLEERDITFFVRVIKDGRLGYSSFNGTDPAFLAHAVKQAEEKASLPHTTPSLSGFSKPVPIPFLNGVSKVTEETGTDLLVEKVRLIFEKGKGTGALFAGIFWSITGEMAVVNSNGVKLYHPFTVANCQAVTTKGDLAGFSQQSSPDVSQIDAERVAEESLHRALRFAESIQLPPGDYTCLLEEYAVAELLQYLAYMAFTAESVEEGRSVIGLRSGEKITGSSITIWDDGMSPNTFRLPFDVEGVPKKKVVFVNEGRGGEVVYDLFTAREANRESTGHSLPFHYSDGPLPLNLEMGPGESNKQDMLKQIKRGLLVTRFHYIREVHPLKTMVTGMTRDGLYLVENGEVAARVKNLRFTESILKSFETTAAISRERKLLTVGEGEIGLPTGIVSPKVLVEKFSFTGSTNF